MRVLHVIHSLVRGGLENGVVNLLNGLPPGEFSQAVACLDKGGEMADRVRADVPITVLNRKRHDLGLPFRLARLIRVWRPDVVHCRNWNAWPDTVAAHFLAMGSPHRLVWSFHGFADGDWFPQRRQMASRFLARHTDQLMAVCHDAAVRYSEKTGISAARFEVLYNGVDTRRFAPPTDRAALRAALGIPENQMLAVTVASLTPVKDHDSLLTTIAGLALPADVHFLWLGEGALRGELEARIAQLGLGHRVSLPGNSDRIADYLAAADLFILPSRLEGMSNAILEAMACGLPVVARRVGGNPELIEDGVTGFLCRPGEHSDLGLAVGRLACDADLRRGMGEAARRHSLATFSMEAMMNGYAAFYRRVARG